LETHEEAIADSNNEKVEGIGDREKPQDDSHVTIETNSDHIVQDISKLFKEPSTTRVVPQRPVIQNLPTTRAGRKTKTPQHLQGFVAK
jgi:hypothetical protein